MLLERILAVGFVLCLVLAAVFCGLAVVGYRIARLDREREEIRRRLGLGRR